MVISGIANGCNKFGIISEVLSLTSDKNAPKKIDTDGYLNHLVKMDFQICSTGFSIAAFWQFAKLAKEADVIHYHFPWPFMDLVHYATRIKKPIIITYHSDIVRQKLLLKFYRPLKNKFLSDADQIVATSPNYLLTSKVLKKFSNKVSIIPIGLDKTSYPNASSNKLEYWKKKFGQKFFLFVGVLRYYKGLHILLEAAKGTSYPVVIVGSGPIESELKSHANRIGLKNIHFLGHISDEDKVALFLGCYAVLFPSNLRSEAFGVSLLEGAMFGKPLISSEIGTGTSFINIHNETGLVVPPNDAIALRQAMTFLWENLDKAELMGLEAERRYRRYFTSEVMCKSYADLYRELIAN